MKQFFVLVASSCVLGGCAIQGQSPTGSVADEGLSIQRQQQVKDSQKIATYFNKLNPQRQPRPLAIEATTLAKAIARYAPVDFRVYVSPDVDLTTRIQYDPSKQWIDALGGALENEKIELSVNISKKTLIVKPLRVTIAEVLEKYVPSDYKAYADANVNLDTYIKYDNSRQWFEALGEPLANAGIEMTANVNKKLMLLRQIYIDETAEQKQAAPAPRETQGLELFKRPTTK